MPIDDLIDLALNYDQAKGIDSEHKQSSSSRILFFYGTVFSQRDEMLIGKLAVDFIYKREIVEVTSNRISGVSVSNDLYLQKEVYINRKIPLNGYLNIEIGDLNDLRNSLDSIEYLMSLYNHPDSRDNMQNRTSLSAKEDFYSNKRVENIDRKRALLKIYKEGLNIGVVASVFDETPELKNHFGSHHTKVVFKTLNPDFNDDHEYRIKMDTSIFDHFKYRSAVFEIRHYFVEDSDSLLDLGRRGEEASEADSEFQIENRDYITLGYAKVSLVNLITKSNGVDQDVAVLDSFSQKLGYLRIKMSLNYQSKKKLKILKNPQENFIEGQYLLCFSFAELISQNNTYLESKLFSDEVKHLIFKFKWEDNTYQIRYVPDDNITHLPFAINVYKLNKMCIADFDINSASIERAAKPIEIQMWTKVENKRRCMKDVEELIGSVFVDISQLISKRCNPRIRSEAAEIFNSHDGYYTVLNNNNGQISCDRLGMSIMLIKNEYKGHKDDLDKMFYTLHNFTQKHILDEHDLNLKGSIDINDLKQVIDTQFKDKHEIDLAYRYIYLLELKSPDTTFYSPIMNVLPPFIKYARRIDKEQIIEFMYKRLSSVDTTDKCRFVDNNMFRSILECEVNLKEKIVSDFVNNLKPNPLDYNLTTHTMKLKTDYLLLTKKLYEYLLHFGIMKIDPEVELSSIEKIHESQLPTYKVPEERMCSLKVSIICGNNIKNPIAETAPPNAYICMNVPFETEEKELRTPVVYRTTFPQWNYDYEIKGISINDICCFLMRNELEFDIYHKKMPTDGMYTNQESILIGRTYIDASALVKNPDCMSISGYYHIFKDRTDKDIDNYADTIQATQGQIRIELKVSKPLLCEYDTEKRQHKAVLQNFNLINKDYSAVEETKLEPEDALQRAIRSAQELRAKHRELNQKDTAAQIRKLSRSPEPVPRRQRDENYDSNVMPTSIEELRFKKEMHLKELADMTLRMKLSLQGGRPDLDEDSPERNDDMFARDSSSAFEEVSDNS